MRVVLIGAGNVGFHLGQLLKKKGFKIVQLYSRTIKNGRPLAAKLKCELINNASDLFTDADLYILALRDESLQSFLNKISFVPKLIVHTSGSMGLEVFPMNMKNTGVLYPLQTFSKSNQITPEKIPFCIEASNAKSLSQIHKLAKQISPLVYKINSSQREWIHVAAVFANNFTNHMFTIADNILAAKKIPFEILKPLIEETIKKIEKNTPFKMQSGPAARGDLSILKKHNRLLKNNKRLKDIYNALSKSIEKDLKNRN